MKQKLSFPIIGVVCATLFALALYSCQKEFSSSSVSPYSAGRFLTGFFDIQYKALETHQDASSIKRQLALYIQDEAVLNEETESILTQKQVYADNGIVIERGVSESKVDSIQKLDDANYLVRASVKSTLQTDAISVMDNKPIVTESLTDYLMTIHVADGHWTISNIKEVTEDKGPDASSFLKAPIETSAAKPKTISYSAANAVRYARLNAIVPFTQPCSLYFLARGGDCTNFVSNCLKAGGWTENNVWYTKLLCYGSSYAWGGADPFRKYIGGSNRVSSAAVANLSLGDVISVEWDGDSSFDHNVIVTNKDSHGRIYLSYHTHNTLDKLYEDFIAKAKKDHKRDPKVQAFKVKATYTE